MRLRPEKRNSIFGAKVRSAKRGRGFSCPMESISPRWGITTPLCPVASTSPRRTGPQVPSVISRISHRQTSCCKHVVGAVPVSERDKNRQRWSAERRISRNLVVGVGEVKRHNGENTRVSFDIHLGWVARYGKYEEKNRDARRNIWGKRLRTRVCERLPRSS